MNYRLLNRSLREIRASFDAPGLETGAVIIAVHEAAHAVSALAYGIDVSALSVRLEGNRYNGDCQWVSLPADDEEYGVMFAAGAASLDFLSDDFRSGNPWDAADDDLRRIIDEFTTRSLLDYYRASAVTLLDSNTRALDRLASALIAAGGNLDQRAIHAIAKPGMAPDKDAPLSAWTRAQRHAMADTIEAMVRADTLPASVRRQLEALQPKSTPKPGIPAGLRYGDMQPLQAPPAPGGYEHRMLRGAR